ncbi:metal-dependent hydrolase [Serratia microhaemolytica]|uniref:metal-dependent hydrolase n=1 Tax=Serratia microhaemolytica TaxID=2675110 RepID=UPI000FDD778D|nr:metal-dependent hydrolase [Serratia microhaemolytica]
MLLVDSHCHLDSLSFGGLHQNVDDALRKAKEHDVGFVLAVATTLPGYQAMTALIGQRSDVAFSCGVHPLNLDGGYDYAELQRLAASEQVVALGETGLDYFYQQQNMTLQQESFRQHIRIARQLNKPLIVHTREARHDTLAVLREEQADECGGVLHCFTEDIDTAKALLDLGFYISFSGIVTFRNAESLREVARYVPLERMLVETDAPYLAPVPHRGKENQPAYVRDVAEYLSVLKGVTLQQLANTTSENFSRLFKIALPAISSAEAGH